MAMSAKDGEKMTVNILFILCIIGILYILIMIIILAGLLIRRRKKANRNKDVEQADKQCQQSQPSPDLTPEIESSTPKEESAGKEGQEENMDAKEKDEKKDAKESSLSPT